MSAGLNGFPGKPLRLKCLQCEGDMPSSLKQADGQRFSRSTSISIIDKDGRFCTLRCAARYGVRSAIAQGVK